MLSQDIVGVRHVDGGQLKLEFNLRVEHGPGEVQLGLDGQHVPAVVLGPGAAQKVLDRGPLVVNRLYVHDPFVGVAVPVDAAAVVDFEILAGNIPQIKGVISFGEYIVPR